MWTASTFQLTTTIATTDNLKKINNNFNSCLFFFNFFAFVLLILVTIIVINIIDYHYSTFILLLFYFESFLICIICYKQRGKELKCKNVNQQLLKLRLEFAIFWACNRSDKYKKDKTNVMLSVMCGSCRYDMTDLYDAFVIILIIMIMRN